MGPSPATRTQQEYQRWTYAVSAVTVSTEFLTKTRHFCNLMTKYMRNEKSSSHQLRSSHHRKPHSSSRFKKVSSKEIPLAAIEKCAWTEATCPVCMEFPHSAVLLLCSSHGNGCRPYICASSYQHSNCLDQLLESCRKESSEDPDAVELACPLCRGEVKGYTLVEPARKQLNHKRNCMEDGCSYMGTYRELCKHVQKKHPYANPRAVDPLHAYRWKRLLFRSLLQDRSVQILQR